MAVELGLYQFLERNKIHCSPVVVCPMLPPAGESVIREIWDPPVKDMVSHVLKRVDVQRHLCGEEFHQMKQPFFSVSCLWFWTASR